MHVCMCVCVIVTSSRLMYRLLHILCRKVIFILMLKRNDYYIPNRQNCKYKGQSVLIRIKIIKNIDRQYLVFCASYSESSRCGQSRLCDVTKRRLQRITAGNSFVIFQPVCMLVLHEDHFST